MRLSSRFPLIRCPRFEPLLACTVGRSQQFVHLSLKKKKLHTKAVTFTRTLFATAIDLLSRAIHAHVLWLYPCQHSSYDRACR